MRLTLRTLLAYLDNTLDPQDAEALQSKLVESGFATHLVQRIRDVLKRSDLSAPSPTAMGPVEEANVICEYLDSTLPLEQVAEVERACLDSDPHLAEAAACHQILTMALGNPANVAVVLRDRIYHLPGEKKGTQEHVGSFSALAIPEQVNSFDALPGAIPLAPPQEPVRPVGVGDSGVMDAPARLRQRELDDDRAASAGPAIAGSRPRNRDADVYGRQIRPSRVTPWLVTLGLAAILLYALTQIFQPLLDPQKTAGSNVADLPAPAQPSAGTEDGGGDNSTAGIDTTAQATDASGQNVAGVGKEVIDSSSSAVTGERSSSDAVDPTQVEPEADATTATDDATGNAAPTDADMAESNDGEVSPVPVTPVPVTPVPATPVPATPEPKPDATEPVPPNPGSVPPAPEPKPPASGETAGDAAAKPDIANPPAESVLGKVLSEKTLVAMASGEEWIRLGKDAEVIGGRPLVVAPGFRASLAIPDSEITFIGPVSATLMAGDGTRPIIRLKSGRMLVSAAKPEVQVRIQLDDKICELEFQDVDSVAAVSIRHTREPGLDPLKAESHVAVRDVITVQGSVILAQAGEVQTLQPSQQWTQVGVGEPLVNVLETMPDWVASTAVDANVLATTARADLLSLIEGASSLEIALRESLSFRRSEVAALAAKTLLVLGRSDVYFGGSGILSEAKQRVYWPRHYELLLSRVDLDAASAAEIQQSIHKMDSASEVPLFRMLTGYSDKQLQNGGDLELLEFLDSSDMSVRVFAFENLNRITGVTLNYRAEQENQGRRSQTVKKWQTWQRKGEIRWKK